MAWNLDDVLVVEISGKRPGGIEARPTEQFDLEFDHLIISNNSEDYATDWEIVNVPDDYVSWYKDNCRQSENMWYAQMNRSYAIKYAREHGYKYCVQLDDNIEYLEIAYIVPKDGYSKAYRRPIYPSKEPEAANDFVAMLIDTLDNTSAAMAGMNLSSVAPGKEIIRERYCYSFFALKLDKVPPYFHGDFEDDIEFRLKLRQMNLPVVQLPWLRYSKVPQARKNDTSGCRAEYNRVGTASGDHMRKLYGDVYTAGTGRKNRSTTAVAGAPTFNHRVKGFEVGCTCKDVSYMKERIKAMLIKYAPPAKERIRVKAVKHG